MWHTFVQPQPACSVMTVELCRPRHPPRTVHTEVLLHVIHHLPQPYQPSSMQNIKYRFECLFETLLLEPQAVIWRLPVAASDPSCVPGSIACDHIQTLCLCSPLAVLVPLMLLRLKKAKLWHFCRSTYSSLFIFVCLMACSFCTVVHVHCRQTQSSLPELKSIFRTSDTRTCLCCKMWSATLKTFSCFQLKHHLWAEELSSAPRSTSTVK